MVLKKIHHLIRYFLFLGIIAFVGYIKRLHDEIFLALTGPCLYAAHAIKSFFDDKIYSFPDTDPVKYFGFLLPVCLIYYGFTGYQLKQLWNERGTIKFVILTIFIGFIGYIHYLSYKNLTGYLAY